MREINSKQWRLLLLLFSCFFVVSLFIPLKTQAATGWSSFDDGRYYYNPDGTLHTGWLYLDGRYYLFDDNGKMVTGWRDRGGARYYFYSDTGYMAVGVTSLGGKLYYFQNGGQLYRTEGWLNLNGYYYFVKQDGSLATGWYKRGGATYYFHPSTGIMATGIQSIDGKKYFFRQGGQLTNTSEWVCVNYQYYLTNSDGTLVVGWKDRGGATYYFYTDTATMARGIVPLGNKLYYFQPGGALYKKPGWLQIGTAYYLVEDDFSLTVGWRVRGGATYYFDPVTGKMSTGYKAIEGKHYYFSSGGQLLGEDPMAYKAQNYASKTGYLILVDCSNHRVGVFSGEKGSWEMIDTFPCGDGTSDTPTPLGVYAVTSKFDYFDSGNARCWYATGFITTEYLFHSILYYQESSPRTIMDPTLGTAVSHGCVRLELSKCKWIYDNIPLGTTVVTYR